MLRAFGGCDKLFSKIINSSRVESVDWHETSVEEDILCSVLCGKSWMVHFLSLVTTASRKRSPLFHLKTRMGQPSSVPFCVKPNSNAI